MRLGKSAKSMIAKEVKEVRSEMKYPKFSKPHTSSQQGKSV